MTPTSTSSGVTRTDAARDVLVERIIELRPVMKRLFGAGIYKELRADLHTVTIHQLSALGLLKNRSLSMRELAKELDVSESSATAIADRLVSQGLAERSSDPADRRIVRLTLSEAGTSLVERMDETTRCKAAEALAALTRAQLEQLIDILETLAASGLDDPSARHHPGDQR
jgi:DNA-binding MarR family transcriptional regulator